MSPTTTLRRFPKITRRSFNKLIAAAPLAAAGAPFTALTARADDDKREYVITDLGVLNGGDYSIGNAINSRGVVAGMATANGSSHAVMLVELELLGLGKDVEASAANDLNRNRDVVGFISSAEVGGQRATLWRGEEQIDLGTLGGPFSIAHGINDRGDVVGEAWIDENGTSHAFVWQDELLSDLGTLGGDYSIAMDINNDGLICGLSTSETNKQLYGSGTKAVLWGKDGMVDLGSLGGDVAAGVDINEKGWVAGGATTEAGIEYGAPGTHAFLWKEGQILDLGTFDGADFSMANGLNKNGEVVGFAGNPDPDDGSGSAMAAALWDKDGVLINLNDTISNESGWFLVTAIGINDKGQITGLGLFEGLYRGFLLDPKG